MFPQSTQLIWLGYPPISVDMRGGLRMAGSIAAETSWNQDTGGDTEQGKGAQLRAEEIQEKKKQQSPRGKKRTRRQTVKRPPQGKCQIYQ